MPQVTVYIREEDFEKWKSIERKSEFMHNALENSGTVGSGVLEEFKKPYPRLCRHGYDPGLCKFKKGRICK